MMMLFLMVGVNKDEEMAQKGLYITTQEFAIATDLETQEDVISVERRIEKRPREKILPWPFLWRHPLARVVLKSGSRPGA